MLPHQPLSTAPSPELSLLLGELFALHRFGIKPGLERIEALCAALGNPERRFPAVHIAGTNGKGTVSSVLASVLQEAGYKTALYTSPHIVRFNERIRINGRPISDEELLRLTERTMPEVRRLEATFFEATTAMAFHHFADEAVDIAVIEVGMGGRLDATNVLQPAQVLACGITSIDFDHQEYLGNTLPEIASEKAGIMKEGVPVVVAEPRPELLLTFLEASVLRQSPLCMLDTAYRVGIESWNADFSMTLNLRSPKQHWEHVSVPLCGIHQARNVLTAFALAEQIARNFPVSEEAFRKGLLNLAQNSGLKGRIELLRPASPNTAPDAASNAAPVLLDVAHNPAGVTVLAETLERCGFGTSTGTRWNIVFTAMHDKPARRMLQTLAPFAKHVFAPRLNIDRARLPENIVNEAHAIGLEATAYSSAEAALDAAFSNNSTPLLIAGSFYLAEEAVQWWERRSTENRD